MCEDNKPLIENKDFRVIQETEKYILGYLWEYAYLIVKFNYREIFLCDFYGVCDAGVINNNDDWCVVGGDIIAIWKNDNVTIIDRVELKWVHSMRIRNNDIVEILIDPWSERASIWELDIKSMNFSKLSDFDSYKGKPYVSKVNW